MRVYDNIEHKNAIKSCYSLAKKLEQRYFLDELNYKKEIKECIKDLLYLLDSDLSSSLLDELREDFLSTNEYRMLIHSLNENNQTSKRE